MYCTSGSEREHLQGGITRNNNRGILVLALSKRCMVVVVVFLFGREINVSSQIVSGTGQLNFNAAINKT